MGYSHAVRQSLLKKVLRPEGRSIVEVSRETGVNEQTIRNWIKRSESGIFDDGNQDSCPRFLTPREKYQLVVEAAGIENEKLGEFLRERGLHSEHITIWDQELRDMIDKKNDPKDQELKELKKKNKELEKELQRKEKALAEAAALLILKKKLDTLTREHEDD
ncbi:MAG: transposase [Chlorobiaceae bacterium]|nr:transposase [Chlorobiaceae bacterium]